MYACCLIGLRIYSMWWGQIIKSVTFRYSSLFLTVNQLYINQLPIGYKPIISGCWRLFTVFLLEKCQWSCDESFSNPAISNIFHCLTALILSCDHFIITAAHFGDNWFEQAPMRLFKNGVNFSFRKKKQSQQDINKPNNKLVFLLVSSDAAYVHDA